MNNATQNNDVANIILAQLRSEGPFGTLGAVGAREFVSTECNGNPTLRFRITIEGVRRHYIEIELTPMDTYTVRLVRVPMRGKRKFERIVENELEGVYCDMLCSTVYKFGTPN